MYASQEDWDELVSLSRTISDPNDIPTDHLLETLHSFHPSPEDVKFSDLQYTFPLFSAYQNALRFVQTSRKAAEEERSNLSREVEKYKRKLEGQNSEVSIPPTRETSLPSVMYEKENVRKMQKELDVAQMELQKLRRAYEEAKGTISARTNDRNEMKTEYDKMQLEYKHLASGHRRLLDKFKKNEDIILELKRAEKSRQYQDDTEIDRLQRKLQALQQENYDLIKSRDYAEELCERRESEALRDMTALKQLSKDLIEEEREKYQSLLSEFHRYRDAMETKVETLQGELDNANRPSDKKSRKPRHETFGKGKWNDDATSGDDTQGKYFGKKLSSSSYSGSSRDLNSDDGISNRHRMERVNDELLEEIQQLELRLETQEEENKRLNRLVKEYELEDDGLRRLHNEMDNANRTIEVLQEEKVQLMERLNNMEDSVIFSNALLELCRQVGVTEEEINSLRPGKASRFSEIETLREEVASLKEECEWLEKERRHWMNKVRLQPLLHTKLRFELGLSSQQLSQLDNLVEKMKSGTLVLEDDDTENYKKKYFLELRAKREQAERFNEFISSRLDEAMKKILKNQSSQGDNLRALQTFRTLKDQLSGLSENSNDDFPPPHEESGQLQSALNRIEQCELTIKDNAEVIEDLRGRVAGLMEERNVLTNERDTYRSAVFDEYPSLEYSGVRRGDFNKKVEPNNLLKTQLEAKDRLISSLKETLEGLKEEIRTSRSNERTLNEKILSLQDREASQTDQIAALNEMCEELNENVNRLTKTNDDLSRSLEESSDTEKKVLLQKVVLLRQREAKLKQRLRHAVTEKEEAETKEKSLRDYVNGTFASLKAALEGSSTGYVLPRSSATATAESELLSYLGQAVEDLTHGKLYTQDSSFLLQLGHFSASRELNEEASALRIECTKSREEVATLREKVAIQAATIEKLAKGGDGTAALSASLKGSEFTTATAAGNGDTDLMEWRQKYTLCTQRLESKEKEAIYLEGELELCRGELREARDQLQQFLKNEDKPSGRKASPQPSLPAVDSEREIARLKSVNLGLLHHSLELQAEVKSLQVDLEARVQEISLIRDSGDTRVVSDFVSAAIREHASLRRQNEIALIQVKRSKMQLLAAEANLRVVLNEASSYKLSAYRLYRKFVGHTIGVVDYIRMLQRECKGAISSRRAEAMHQRFIGLVHLLEESMSRNKKLASELTTQKVQIEELEQQVTSRKPTKSVEREAILESQLLEVRSSLRLKERELTEALEDRNYALDKCRRAEEYSKRVDEEVSRLEFGYGGTSLINDQLLSQLQELKDTIFSKAEAPPLAVELVGSSIGNDLGSDTVIHEYKSLADKQALLSRECTNLKQQLEQIQHEKSALEVAARTHQDEMNILKQKVTYFEEQLQQAKASAESREKRLAYVHDVQSAATYRAAEHNNRCLTELLKNKEKSIQHLQAQLEHERKRYQEYQLGEAVRLEKMHEQLYRENNAMVERFRDAISGPGSVFDSAGSKIQSIANAPSDTSNNQLGRQLQALTEETLRLQKDLRAARETNIILEAQIKNQISNSGVLQNPLGNGSGASITHNTDAAINAAANNNNNNNNNNRDGANGLEMNLNLTGVIHDQTVLIDSMRRREGELSSELERTRQQLDASQERLANMMNENVERQAALEHLMRAGNSEPAVQRELKAQIAYLESQLSDARAELAKKSAASRTLLDNTREFNNSLNELQGEIETNKVDAERARHLASLNESLQNDLKTARDQNEKLILAVTALKQKLMEEYQRGGEAERKYQKEIALTQRMGAIQEECSASMKALDKRVKEIQKELDAKARNEEEILKRNKGSQLMIFEINKTIMEKDKEIRELRSALQRFKEFYSQIPQNVLSALSSANQAQGQIDGTPTREVPAPTENGSTTPAVYPNYPIDSTSAPEFHTHKGGAPISQPALSNMIARETMKSQRDNLQEISFLRSQLHRLQKDTEQLRLQLAAENELKREAKIEVQRMQRQMEEMHLLHAREVNLFKQGMREHGMAITDPNAALQSSIQQGAKTSLPPGPLSHPPEGNVVSTIKKLAADFAAMKGVSVQEILEGCNLDSLMNHDAIVSKLEEEILQKNTVILDLRLQKEALELKLNQIQRHTADEKNATANKEKLSDGDYKKIQYLEATIVNQKVMLDKLTAELATWRNNAEYGQRYVEAVKEIKDLKEQENRLREENDRLSKYVLSFSQSGRCTLDQLQHLQQKLNQANTMADKYREELQHVQKRLGFKSSIGQESGVPVADIRGATQALSDFSYPAPPTVQAWSGSDVPPPLPSAPYTEIPSGLPNAQRRLSSR